MTGDKPSQRIDACEEYHLELVDMTGKSSNDVDKSTRSLIKEFIDQKIEPTLGPLFDSRVFKVADDEHILVISIDHLITDAVSIRIFVEELWTMYEQGVNEEPASLTPLSLQYADYALWLEKVYPTWRNVHQSYWEKRLAGAPSISWPTDGNTVEHKVIGLASMKVPIGDRLTAALAGFARRARTLPALVVLAAYVSAVSRWCNQTDLTVSFVDNGRHRPALSRMLGLLASHLHLRFELTRGDKHRDLLELVKMEFYNALYHRDFDWVQSLIPQFQPDLLFNWVPLNTKECTTFGSDRPAHKNRLEWLHLALSREAYSDLKNVLPYKLLLVCCYEGRELTANLHYRNDLFSTEIVDRLARNLRFSLESTVYGLPAIPASNQRDLWD